MVTVLLALNFLLMIGLPIVFARKIAVQYQVGWRLFGIGAVAFILAQVAHIPFNLLIVQQLEWVTAGNLILYAAFLGLSAGSFEGVARYLTFRFWARQARSWRHGVMVGMGHGGIEAIGIGALGLLNFIVLWGLREGYFRGLLVTVPAEQLPLVDQQIAALFSVPLPMALYGALERVFALLLHLSASLLVMQAVVRQQMRWLGAGILWHAVIDGVLVYVVVQWGVIMAELVLGVMSFVSLGIIFALRTADPVATELPPLPELQPLVPIEPTKETVERSRYSS